jgi:hypothetical protein
MKITFKWLLISLVILGTSACGLIQTEPTITTSPTGTPSPSTTNTLTITPSPLPTITYTPSPTPLAIGESGLVVFETGSHSQTGEYNSSGINLILLRDMELSFLFPAGYHLEGISPDTSRLLISKENNLYTCTPAGQELTQVTDFFYHQYPDYVGGKSAYWDPSSDRIFFLGLKNNLVRIYSIKPDGNDLKTITEATSRFIAIDTVANGDLYWTQESPMYWVRQTNLNTLDTNIIYWDFHDNTEFSPNQQNILDWIRDFPITSDIQEFEKWKNPLSLGLREILPDTPFRIGYSNEYINRRNLQLSLRELIDVEEEYKSAFIKSAWWNPDNERFLVCVSKCVTASSHCECRNYFLFDTIGHLIKEVMLPKINDYQYDPDAQEIIEMDMNPGHFTLNTWSPDGKYLIFHDYSSIILYNIETEVSTQVKIALGDPMYTQLFWISNGERFLDQIEDIINITLSSRDYGSSDIIELPEISADQSNLPSSDLPAHINITEAHYTISEDRLIFTLTLQDLPDHMIFNRSSVCDNCTEYEWGVFINSDNDTETGYAEWVTGYNTPGWEYTMALSSLKEPGVDPSTMSISDAAEAVVKEQISETSWMHVGFADFSIDTDKNSISIQGKIPGINPEAKILFYSYDFNKEGNILIDYLIP